MTVLQQEAQTYRARLPFMLGTHEGQYVVIKGTEIRHFSDSYEDALDWAYETFGLDEFFVKQVTLNQGLAHFTRDLGPCRI